jgi:DTW domain-containing protein YfiP
LKSKSTSIHAKILASDDVTLYEFPEFPDFRQNSREVLLLFPSEVFSERFAISIIQDAQFVEDTDFTGVKRLIVIDSTWQQTKKMLKDERLDSLPCVKIRTHKTNFWR